MQTAPTDNTDKRRDENSYRNILKGTSAFGGVQLFQILSGLVRGKFVAIFLGPAGMGVSALFTTTLNTVQQFVSLGLNLAIVKEVVARRDNPDALASAMKTGRRLIYSTALLGAIFCLLFCRALSDFAFGDGSYTGWFACLSVTVFFTVAGAGELSLLQGLHAVKRISMASLVGASAGLFLGVPLYWLFGTAGIVPAMTVLALTTWIFYLFSVKAETKGHPRARFVWNEQKPLIKKLIGLGLVLMASNLLSTLVTYIINAFVRYSGTLTDVGLYQAANSLTNQYMGLIFAAMSLDYFPRLSAVAADNSKMCTVSNRQTEVMALVATPLIVALIIASPLVVHILLTKDFLPVVPLIRWLAFAILFRSLMFPLGYISFAKDNKRLYFIMEGLLLNLLTLMLSTAGYWIFGLNGLGIALLTDSFLCLIIYYLVNRHYYGFTFTKRSLRLIIYAAGSGTLAFLASLVTTEWLSYTLMGIIAAATAAAGATGLLRLFREK